MVRKANKLSNNKKNQNMRGSGQNSQTSILLDRGLALSDGSVTSLQDTHELKAKSNSAPTRVPRSLANQSYWARLSRAPVTITGSTVTNVFDALYFALGNYAEYTDYTTVFDQYCMVETVIRIVPQITATANTTLSTLITCIDHDDAVAPTTVAAVQAHTSFLETVNLAQTRLIRPRFAVAAYQGAFTGYSSTTGYVDCANSGIQHYGLKIALLPSGQVTSWTIFEESIFHFRDNI
jgi:hypothetical protein